MIQKNTKQKFAHACSVQIQYEGYLSGFVAKLISPLAGKTDTYVKDSEHFMEMMKDVCI